MQHFILLVLETSWKQAVEKKKNVGAIRKELLTTFERIPYKLLDVKWHDRSF